MDDIFDTFTRQITQDVSKLLNNVIGPRGIAFSLWILSSLYTVTATISKLAYRTFGAVLDEFSTNGNIWVFLDTKTTPIPYKVFNECPEFAKWFYNAQANSLYESISCKVSSYYLISPSKLPWIMSVISSEKLNSDGEYKPNGEWYLDSWVNEFFMSVHENYYINPRIILSCWSIQSGVWFSESDKVRLEIIDKNGNNVVFNNVNCELSDEDKMSWRRVLGLESTPMDAESSADECESESIEDGYEQDQELSNDEEQEQEQEQATSVDPSPARPSSPHENDSETISQLVENSYEQVQHVTI